MVVCEAVVSGTCENACENVMPFFATPSRFGVRPFLEPRKPMRSARVVSSVIRMILGRVEAAAARLLAGVVATAEQSRKRTGTTGRRNRIEKKKGVYHSAASQLCTQDPSFFGSGRHQRQGTRKREHLYPQKTDVIPKPAHLSRARDDVHYSMA